MLRMYWLIVLFPFLALGQPTRTGNRADNSLITVKKSSYTFTLQKKGFRYAFKQATGKTIVGAHARSGLRFSALGDTALADADLTQVSVVNDSLLRGIATTHRGTRAAVLIRFSDQYVQLRITPEIPEARLASSKAATGFVIDARTAPLAPAYGLGDHGGFGENTNVYGFENNCFLDTDNEHRFVSNFTVFPAQGMAQVLFERGQKRVAITKTENRLGAAKVQEANVYYFFGSLPEMYKNYAVIKKREGYPDYKPKFEFFDIGYEAFGSLGWNTYQTSVQKDISTYLEKGYPLKWAVVGSGFWKGERKNPEEGATTSFGIWDDTASPGRKDGLPNPRYPDVAGFKQFFAERNILLFLGLRINFKAPAADGGHYTPVNDGEYTREGVQHQYFVADETRKPETFRVNFPQGNVYLLDGRNPRALSWYQSGVKKWGVKGFKEDTMLQDGIKLNDDAKLNEVNEMLMQEGYYVMVRNSAYSVPGDIIRLEDTKYGFDQDRPLINVLNYAASGAPNTYPDIVAGKYLTVPLTQDQKRYFVRNAMMAAVCPAMSVGLGPWHLEHPAYEQAVKKAVDWHHQLAPYIYSAAVESFLTGYPYTMTPLPVAFPRDSNTYHLAGKTRKQYSWMLGPSLLAAPAYGSDYATVGQRDVYLPEGKWMDYETGKIYQGPMTLPGFSLPDDKIPVFVGGKGVLVRQSPGQTALQATIYPVSPPQSVYQYYYPDGKTLSTISHKNKSWKPDKVSVYDLTSGQPVQSEYSPTTQSFSFYLTPGHDYQLRDK